MLYSLDPKKNGLDVDNSLMSDDRGRVDVPNFSLAPHPIIPSAPNSLEPKRKSLLTPKTETKIIELKSKIMNYILSDCNSFGKVIDRSNINLVVDPATREIVISASARGSLCLNAVNKNYIQQIALNATNEPFKITFNSN